MKETRIIIHCSDIDDVTKKLKIFGRAKLQSLIFGNVFKRG